jgi:hypothetical protein
LIQSKSQIISKLASKPELFNISVHFSKVNTTVMYNYNIIIQCPRFE